MNNFVVAIVVTYNRIELLRENIKALLDQKYQCDIIVVDNGSSDGTDIFMKSLHNDKIMYFNTGKNLGGAGGFSYGVELAESRGYKYFWIMDDDSIPDKDALSSLIEKANYLKDDFSFLSSVVYWTDGKLFPMNIPEIIFKTKMQARIDLISEYKVIPVNACSFVGCFVNIKISRNIGLPIAEFFIYGDDEEYTKRLRKVKPAYLDLDSRITHKAPSNKGADISTASVDRIERFYYQSRNGMYIARKTGFKAVLKRVKIILVRAIKIMRGTCEKKLSRLWVLLKGSFSGMFFNPTIKYTQIDNLE